MNFAGLLNHAPARTWLFLAAGAAIACVEIDSREVLPPDLGAAEVSSGGALNTAGSAAHAGSNPVSAGAPAVGGARAAGGSAATGGPHATAGASQGGAGATAPAASHAGAPAGGASSVKSGACVPLKGDATQLLIDDLEDGDNEASTEGGRLAFWFGFNDGVACTQMPPVESAFKPTAVGTPATNRYVAEISGTGCTAWGAGIGVEFNRNNDVPDGLTCPYDLGPYTGVSFYFRSSGPVTVLVSTMQTRDKSLGGSCDTAKGRCDDHYQITFPGAAAWTKKTVHFKELAQFGFGQPVPFDPTQSTGLTFQIAAGATATTAYDLALDDLNFVLD